MTTYNQAIAYNAAIGYNGPAADRNPSRHLKFEVAFTTTPLSGAPVWVDLTSRLDLNAGIVNRCGRTDEYDLAQTGACDLVLDNTDGALTPDNAASPYYPNTLPQKRARLTYIDPSTLAVTPRVDGVIDEWPVEWPGGQQYSEARVTLVDLFSWLGSRDKLRSVVVETMALDGPVLHFPLGEPDGATLVADIANAEPVTLSIQQHGVGGTIGFGAGTGVPTDGLSAPVFTAAALTQGKVLSGPIPAVGPSGYAGGLTLVAAAATTSVLDNVAACLSNSNGARLMVGYDAAPGEPYAIYQDGLGNSAVALGTAGQNDGQTRDIAAVLSGDGVDQITLSLYVNGVFVTSQTSGPFQIGMQPMTRLTIGGDGSGQCYTGTVSHVAVFPTAVSAGHLLDQRTAQTTGFSGERSDQRIARICSWIGFPAGFQALDVGKSTSIAHVDSAGMTPLEYMRKIEATESGLLFIGPDGKLTFHSRARAYAATAPAISVPAQVLDDKTRLAKNTQFVVNDVTGTRAGGATVRQLDQASKDAFGPHDLQLELVTTSDDEVRDAVSWRLQTGKDPRTRYTNMQMDAYTDGVNSPAMLTAVKIGARVEVTGLPATTAPAGTMRQTVQGYVETITHSRWELELNTTPYEHLIGLILDDPVYGVLDSTNHLVY